MKKLVLLAILALSLSCSAQVKIWKAATPSGGTPLFNDGFEGGTLAAWTDSTTSPAPALDSTTKYAGTYAGRITASTAGQEARLAAPMSSTYSSGQTVYLRAYVYNANLGSGIRYDYSLLGLGRADGVLNAGIMLDSSNTFQVYDGVNGGYYLGTQTLSYSTWYRVEMKVVLASGPTGSIEARLYNSSGTLLDTILQTGIPTSFVTSSDVIFGCRPGVSRTFDLRVDNVSQATDNWLGS